VSSTDTTRFPVRITTNGTYTIIASDIIGTAHINFFSINLGDNTYNASDEFTPTTVIVSDVSAVPLPDTAWLLLSSLAGIGATARRRLKPA
jgi:hypothetical protein